MASPLKEVSSARFQFSNIGLCCVTFLLHG
jgi:hypothetical protein